MDHLYIEATEISPKVSFDPQNLTFEIIGESRPEDVREFYEPVVSWLTDFSKELMSQENEPATPLRFIFKLRYFNSSSAKFIHDILKKIYDLYSRGIKLKINWCFDEADYDMQEAGEELSIMINLPFNYVEVKE